MTDAWVGVVGTLVGALVGGAIAVFVGIREQQRAPQLQMLEKRIGAYSRLYRRLFEIAACLQRNEHESMAEQISKFRETTLDALFYLDRSTQAEVLEVYNCLMGSLSKGELDPKELGRLIETASKQLRNGIGMKYA